MSSMLPMRRRVNDWMLFGDHGLLQVVGQERVVLKIVSAVGVPTKMARGVLYWWMWVRPRSIGRTP